MNPFLLLISLLPAVMLLVRVYQLDKIEKEPPKLLIKMALFGALGGALAAPVELLLLRYLSEYMDTGSFWYSVLANFVAVALVEELCKRFPVRRLAWKDSAFDYRFDAVVYCVFSALGFAALENVLYVAQSGFGTALARAVLSVPGHCFFGVSMGLYLGQAKQDERDGEGYEMLRSKRSSLLVPVLLHGFWDFCLSLNDWRMVILFYVFVLIFFLTVSRKLRKASDHDQRIS